MGHALLDDDSLGKYMFIKLCSNVGSASDGKSYFQLGGHIHGSPTIDGGVDADRSYGLF